MQSNRDLLDFLERYNLTHLQSILEEHGFHSKESVLSLSIRFDFKHPYHWLRSSEMVEIHITKLGHRKMLQSAILKESTMPVKEVSPRNSNSKREFQEESSVDEQWSDGDISSSAPPVTKSSRRAPKSSEPPVKKPIKVVLRSMLLMW